MINNLNITLDGQCSSLGSRPNRVRTSAAPLSASAKYKAQPCMPVDQHLEIFLYYSLNLVVQQHFLARYKSPASSVVDRVLLTANETDQFLVKVMIRQCRRPEVGDKHIRQCILWEVT